MGPLASEAISRWGANRSEPALNLLLFHVIVHPIYLSHNWMCDINKQIFADDVITAR